VTVQDNEGSLQQIEGKVRALANAALSGGKPLLLSALGKDLGDDLNLLKSLTAGGLSRFIHDRMGSEFAIVLGGQFRNVQAVVKAGTAGNFDSAVSADVGVPEVKAPRYHYKFWAAFSVPLPPERKRILDPATLGFDDVPFEEVREGWRPIGNDFIVDQHLPERNRMISQQIDRWLSAEGEDQSRFLQPTRMRPEKISVDFQSTTLLDVLIQSLDSRQLASTTMSLDAVAALLKKRL
jgi:hypothetical protein